MLDLGDNLSEKDEEYNFEEEDEAESVEEEEDDDFDPKEVIKKLKPIIQKRIQYIELICEQKKKSVIQTKDGTISHVMEWNKMSKKCHDERSKTTYGDSSALPAIDGASRTSKLPAIDGTSRTSKVVERTPLKKLSNKTNFEEIEETVTTTTVTTTTKKIRRVVSLDRNDENTIRAKRKLSIAPIDEDEFESMDSEPKKESRRKTIHGVANLKKTRSDHALAMQTSSIVLYEPVDAPKYNAKHDDKFLLDAEVLNQAILDKTHNNESFDDPDTDILPVQMGEKPVQVERNETLFYQTGQTTTTDLARVIKTKSKVDPLRRMSLVAVPKLYIESKAKGKSKWNRDWMFRFYCK